MRHFVKHRILTDKQHGYRAKRSCETQLISTIQKIARRMTGKGQMDVILLDFAKAFDKVPHRRLLHKIDFCGVRECTLGWIESFLRQRKPALLKLMYFLGCLKGTVLWSLLFLAFINVIYEALRCQVVCRRLSTL